MIATPPRRFYLPADAVADCASARAGRPKPVGASSAEVRTLQGSHRPSIRRLLGWTLVVCLCVAALVAIVALLSGSFDDTDWRLIGTSLSFAVYSALAASGTALRVKGHRAALPLGVATAATAAIGFLLVLLALWLEDPGEGLVRTWGVVTIAALVCSHAAVVLRGTRGTDTRAITALVVGSILLAGLDGTVGALATAGTVDVDEDDPGARWMAVTVVLLLLTTGLPPLLRRMGRTTEPLPQARDGGDSLAQAVIVAADRIERLDDPAAVRAECRRLRELARARGG
jgi:hypothetical protein